MLFDRLLGAILNYGAEIIGNNDGKYLVTCTLQMLTKNALCAKFN